VTYQEEADLDELNVNLSPTDLLSVEKNRKVYNSIFTVHFDPVRELGEAFTVVVGEFRKSLGVYLPIP
jgi:hypothetical protein